MGVDAASVGAASARRRRGGDRVAAFVGDDEEAARALAEEMLGGLDELVVVGQETPAPPGEEPGATPGR